jgi:GT2 family glycosyltransferase
MNKKVSIILLNYNGYDDTIECFNSLKEISYPNYNIVIVDNNSPDKSLDKINEYMIDNNCDFAYYKDVQSSQNTIKSNFLTLIQSGSNEGYGHGNNIGIKYALKNNADYIMILNNDTVVSKNFLESMVYTCENNNKIGIVSGQIFYFDEPDVFWFNGGIYDKYTFQVKHFSYKEEYVGQKPLENNTFLSGCLWLIPKDLFSKVGYLNEDYFMYVEDLEFSQRVIKSGYQLKVAENAFIYHKVGGSSNGETSSFSVYWMTKNYLKFMVNNVNIIFWPLFITNNILRFTIKFFFSRKKEFIKKQFFAFYDFIRNK